jgi:hypothetical protein
MIKVKLSIDIKKVIEIEAHDLKYRSINEYIEEYVENVLTAENLLADTLWELEIE